LATERAAGYVALAAAAALAVTGVVEGTWAAGGSDSSCYALMADAFAHGEVQPTSTLAREAPWPNASLTTAPAGFIPSPVREAAASPVCAPGFSLLLTPLRWVGGTAGIFLGTPLANALLIWFVYVFTRELGGASAGAAAAVLVAATPILLFQAVQPMNDVTTAMLWMAVLAASTRTGRSREWLMGLSLGLALLVRPNLALSAIFVGLWVLSGPGAVRTRIANATRLTTAAAVPVVVLLALNDALYGHPLRVGYGDPGVLFSARHLVPNLENYAVALMATTFGLPLLGFGAPFVTTGARHVTLLALGVAASTIAVYLFYRPFDEWWYLRFLLPAIVPLMAMATVVIWRTVEKVSSARSLAAVRRFLVFAVAMVAMAFLQVASDRQAFELDRLERRFWRAGEAVRDTLPPNAIVIAVWQSGTMRFHARREAVLWDSLDPTWLDRAVEWLTARGYEPYFLLERWEEPQFRQRFAAQSPLGALDWPPAMEVERQVRLYRPADRQRYLNGETIPTRYVAQR
jgi:hypothetical protein